MIKSSILIICCIAFCGSVTSFDQTAKILPERKVSLTGFTNAAEYGFSTDSSGIKNTKALQLAVDQTGTIIVSQPGTYKMAGTVYIGSNTSLIFGNNVFLKKVDEHGAFSPHECQGEHHCLFDSILHLFQV